MLFLNEVVKSYDIQGEISLLVHTTNECNLNCYGCFNKHICGTSGITADEMLNKLRKGVKTNFIIFSGSEFLSNEPLQVVRFLQEVRAMHNWKIIIYTNGTNPDLMKRLRKANLVDGFHMDVKLPYWILNDAYTGDKRMFHFIVGVPMTKAIIKRFIKSLKFLSKTKTKYDLTRTVNYPFYPAFMIKEIQEQMLHNELPWTLNPFIYSENNVDKKL